MAGTKCSNGDGRKLCLSVFFPWGHHCHACAHTERKWPAQASVYFYFDSLSVLAVSGFELRAACLARQVRYRASHAPGRRLIYMPAAHWLKVFIQSPRADSPIGSSPPSITWCRKALIGLSRCPSLLPALPSHGGDAPAAHEGPAGLLRALGGRHARADRAGAGPGRADRRVGDGRAAPAPAIHAAVPQVHEEFKQNIENVSVEMLLRRFAETKGTGRDRPGGSVPRTSAAHALPGPRQPCKALESH
jgi:hypothetical protein